MIALVIAGHPSLDTENGNVVAGSRVFFHDGQPVGTTQNPASQWHDGPCNRGIDSSLDRGVLDAIYATVTYAIPALTSFFLTTPLNPSPTRTVIAS